MIVYLLLFSLSAQAFADVVVYETGWVSHDPKIVRQSWYWAGKGNRGNSYVVEVDSYQSHATTQSEKSSVDTDRLLNWAFQQLSHLAAEGSSGKPVYLDVSVVEKKTTTGPTVKSSTRKFVMTNDNKETRKNETRRTVLMVLLFTSCLASWVLFFVQANTLLKRFRRRQQKKLKKAAKQQQLKVPLLQPEGQMK